MWFKECQTLFEWPFNPFYSVVTLKYQKCFALISSNRITFWRNRESSFVRSNTNSAALVSNRFLDFDRCNLKVLQSKNTRKDAELLASMSKCSAVKIAMYQNFLLEFKSIAIMIKHLSQLHLLCENIRIGKLYIGTWRLQRVFSLDLLISRVLTLWFGF